VVVTSEDKTATSVRRVVCPGSFDPVTNGHLDVISRASRLFDQVIVAVLINRTKASLFTVEERLAQLGEATKEYDNVVIDSWQGLIVDFCKQRDVPVICKGLRAEGDFGYEQQMAQMNHRLAGVETVFVSTNPAYSYLSSSLVKEVATYGGDVSGLVPDIVVRQLTERLTTL
jgi:pantetheine-phosphate adenylyltransferase